jgi:hypothetical protein
MEVGRRPVYCFLFWVTVVVDIQGAHVVADSHWDVKWDAGGENRWSAMEETTRRLFFGCRQSLR